MTETTRKAGREKEETLSCTVCGSKELHWDRSRGERVCTSCGFVMSSGIIDSGPEWRAFTAEERNNRERTGAPTRYTIADKGLATRISRANRDASGRSIGGSRRAQLYRMRKWQRRSWAHGSKQRNLQIAMNEIERLASQLGISRETVETGALVYRKVLDKRLVRGRSIDGMVSASLYLSCRIHKRPRQLDEVAKEAKIDRRQIGKCVRMIQQHLNIHVPLPSAKGFLPRISSDLKLSGRTVTRAAEIITEARGKGLTAGKDPSGIAAAAIYIAGIIEDDRRTQREIADAANVTEVTVRNRYKDMVKGLNISLMP